MESPDSTHRYADSVGRLKPRNLFLNNPWQEHNFRWSLKFEEPSLRNCEKSTEKKRGYSKRRSQSQPLRAFQLCHGLVPARRHNWCG